MSERANKHVFTVVAGTDYWPTILPIRMLCWFVALPTLLVACNQPAPPRVLSNPHQPVAPVAPMVSNPAGDCQAVTARLVRGHIRIEGRKHGPDIRVELAVAEDERNCGLMHRRSLAKDAGMLFVMPYDHHWAFYMRNTYIALDMIFIDKDWSVVGVSSNTRPLTEVRHRSPEQCRYVLELAAHQARRYGIVAGTRLVYDGPTRGGDQDGAN